MSSLFVTCLALLSTSALPSDPPQLHSVVAVGPASLYYGLNGTYRMTNNGSGSYADRLCIGLLYLEPEGYPGRGGLYYNNSGTGTYVVFDPFTSPYATTTAGTTCGTFAGYFGGFQDGADANDFVPPSYWNGTSPTQVTWGSNHRDGHFWDVRLIGSDNWYVGYYYLNGVKQPARWDSSRGVTSPVFLDKDTFDGGEAWCINSNKDIGGQLIDDGNPTLSPPCIWLYDSGSWTLLDLSTETGYLSGGGGILLGITDPVENDADGPYAVGYYTGDGGSNAAQPFIYSIGSGEFKWCGSYYGLPTQISNESHTSGSPIVSFSGGTTNGDKPYIWRGSPDPDDTYLGVANDIWAFMDPDVEPFDDGVGTQITGLNKNFVFGGNGFPIVGGGSNAWISSTTTAWTRVTGSYTFTRGSVTSGSSSSGMDAAEGLFTRIDSGISAGGTDPHIQIQVDANVGSNRNKIAFRVSSRMRYASVTGEYKIDLWKWTGGGSWVNFLTEGTMPAYWDTDFAQTASISDYVDGSGNVRARITVRKTAGIAPTTPWHVDLEQSVFLYK